MSTGNVPYRLGLRVIRYGGWGSLYETKRAACIEVNAYTRAARTKDGEDVLSCECTREACKSLWDNEEIKVGTKEKKP